MRRLGSTFVTVWLIAFVPSLIVWGLLVRASARGVDRFEGVWSWLADLLAFPVLFSPLSNWSWRALETGSAIPATLGFLILVAVWALMLAAPLIFVAGWWVLIAQRLGGRSYTSSPSSVTETSLAATISSPSRALYLITLPLGLLWVGGKHVLAWRTLWIGVALVTLVFTLVAGFLAVMFGVSSYWEREDVLHVVSGVMWWGYLERLHIPQLSEEQWWESMRTIRHNADELRYSDWPDYMGSWYRHAEFRTVVWLTAARHALPVGVLYVAYSVIRRLPWVKEL